MNHPGPGHVIALLELGRPAAYVKVIPMESKPNPVPPHWYAVHPHARQTVCKSCGAALIWATTRNGAHVPLSASQLRQIEGEQYAPSHSLDCPQASGHSKGKRR